MKPFKRISVICASVIAFLLAIPQPGHTMIRLKEDDSTRIHRLHVLMNHGLIMFLDGINMKMVAEMKMSPDVDPVAVDYGRRSMKKGRRAIKLALEGEQIQLLIEQGFGDHPLMQSAYELGEAMLELIDLLEKMKMDRMDQDMMDLHHLHLLINKGLEDVAQGSNMIMATLLSSIPQVDQFLQNHGRNMVKEGRALIVKASTSNTYKRALKGGASKTDSYIEQTIRCTNLSLKISDILSRMEMPKITE